MSGREGSLVSNPDNHPLYPASGGPGAPDGELPTRGRRRLVAILATVVLAVAAFAVTLTGIAGSGYDDADTAAASSGLPVPQADVVIADLVTVLRESTTTAAPTTTKPPTTTTTAAPTTTEAPTTTVPPTTEAPATTAAPPPPPPPVAGDSVWDALAQCESGGNWSINTGNGFYGGIQFMHSTWVNMGGRQWAEYPHEATREQQIEVATRLQAQYGWGQWPACSARLGLR